MADHQELLLGSFPWLTELEAVAISEKLAPLCSGAGPVIEEMRSIAVALDDAGLPPTSSLILGIVGRGSKGTAVQVAREAARARFERAQARPTHDRILAQSHAISPATPNEQDIRNIVQEALAQLPGTFNTAPVANQEVLARIEAIAGDVHWLKSTIDTERQLRRYQQTYGPLKEPGVTPTTAEERRTVVAQLASSLERERFKPSSAATLAASDPVDGYRE